MADDIPAPEPPQSDPVAVGAPRDAAPAWAVNFGTRWSAFVIDAAVLFVGQWLLFLVMSRQLQAAGMTAQEPCVENGSVLCEGPSTALWVLLLIMLVVTTLGYHALFEGRYGATPGKRWMGLRVITLTGEFPIGVGVGMQRSFVRQLPWLLLFLVLDVSPLDLGLPSWLFMLVLVAAVGVMILGALTPSGLALHDRAARTQVVDARSTKLASSAKTSQPLRRKQATSTSSPNTGVTSTSPSETEDLT